MPCGIEGSQYNDSITTFIISRISIITCSTTPLGITILSIETKMVLNKYFIWCNNLAVMLRVVMLNVTALRNPNRMDLFERKERKWA